MSWFHSLGYSRKVVNQSLDIPFRVRFGQAGRYEEFPKFSWLWILVCGISRTYSNPFSILVEGLNFTTIDSPEAIDTRPIFDPVQFLGEAVNGASNCVSPRSPFQVRVGLFICQDMPIWFSYIALLPIRNWSESLVTTKGCLNLNSSSGLKPMFSHLVAIIGNFFPVIPVTKIFPAFSRDFQSGNKLSTHLYWLSRYLPQSPTVPQTTYH